LERVIFQTLLHTARSDVAGEHFITAPSSTQFGDEVIGDDTVTDEVMAKLKEEEDFSVELILKDLIQADAILSVEVGDRSLEKTIDHNHATVEPVVDKTIIADEQTPPNVGVQKNKTQQSLLPPIVTEEEPETLLPATAAVTTTSDSSPDHINAVDLRQHFLPLSQMDENEWEPDFDAVEFPTVTYKKGDPMTHNSSINVTNDTIASTSLLQQSQPHEVSGAPTSTTTMIASTSMSISPNQEPHSSNEESPESDIFDQIDDDRDTGNNYHENGIVPLLLQDEVEIRHIFPMDESSRQNTNIDPSTDTAPSETLLDSSIEQPRVKLYDTSIGNNIVYYEIDAFHEEIASWGLDDVVPVIATETNHYYNSSGKLLSTDVVPITPTKVRKITRPNDVSNNESISFPTILQEEEGYNTPMKQNNTNTTTLSIQNSKEIDEWTSFDVNPFASNTVPGRGQPQSVSSSPIPLQHHENDTLDFAFNHQQPHRIHEILSSNTSQDNGSVSSPSSVVQFTQMIDRCPSSKSDTNNKCTFDTKCSF
jgi:hypothetical protein